MKSDQFFHLFRVDANQQIGLGHIARCAVLANKIAALGGQAGLILSPNSSIDASKFIRNDIKVLTLKKNAKDSLEDAVLVKELLQEVNVYPASFVLDHYQLNNNWFKSLKETYPKTKYLLIDDITNDNYISPDFILNQNYEALFENPYSEDLKAKLLLGPQFALLRPEFSVWREKIKKRSGEVRSIFVSFGGSDTKNLSLRIGNIIAKLIDEKTINIDCAYIIIGELYTNTDEIFQLDQQYEAINVRKSVSNMAEIMSQCDLAISGGGISYWERCCVGLPSLVITSADNQLKSAKALEKEHVISYLGNFDNISDENISQGIVNLINSPEKLVQFSEKSLKITDGNGASKVAQLLIDGII